MKKLLFVNPNDKDSAYFIIEQIEHESKLKFKKKIMIENITVNNYNSAVKVALYYANLNKNCKILPQFQKITNRKLATLFMLLATHMSDRPYDVSPRNTLMIVSV